MRTSLHLIFFLVFIVIISCSVGASETSVDLSSNLTFEKLWEVPVSSGINDVSISGDGGTVVAGGNENLLYYDREGERIWSNEIGLIGTVAVSENGSRAVSGGSTLDLYDSGGNSLIRKNCGYFIKSVAMSGGGDIVYYTTDKEDLFILNTTDGQSGEFDVGCDLVSIAVPDGGGYFAGGSSGGDIIFINSGGKALWTRESYTEKPVIDVDISSEGDFLVYTVDDTVNALFRTGSLLWKKIIHDIGGVTVDASGSYVAVAHEDGITIFDRKGNELTEISDLDRVSDVDISDDGRYLAFCCKDSFGLYSLSMDSSGSDVPGMNPAAGAEITPASGEGNGMVQEGSETATATPRQSGLSGIALMGTLLSFLITGFVTGHRK